MLKAYVCLTCLGKGEIWSPSYQESDDFLEPCPDCVARKLPPKVEVPVDGPPTARELTIDMQAAVVPISMTLDGDPWKTEGSRRACSEEGHLTYGENCFHSAAKPDEDKK